MEAENLRLKKTNTALRQALSSLQKSAEESVGRSSRDSCLRGCQRLGSKDYAACEMRCRLETEKDVAERGAAHYWRERTQGFSHATYTGNERPRGPKMEEQVAYNAGRVSQTGSNKHCPCGNCGGRCCRCFAEQEADVAERGAGHYWRERTQGFSHATYTGNERPRGPKMEEALSDPEQEEDVGFFGTHKCLERNDCIAECEENDPSKSRYSCMKECPKSLCDKEYDSHDHDHDGVVDHDSEDHNSDSFEETIGRSSRDSCLRGCQRLGAKDYAACEMRCRLETEEQVAYSAGRVSQTGSNKHCPCGNCGGRCCRCFAEQEENVGAVASRGGRCGVGKVWNGRRCVPGFGSEEKAVGGSWQNGKCMYYGSYLTDQGASVNDMGTGWSESSCQSECDYSSTTQACQYEFSSQKCLMISFYTNEIYGAGDYDALCYVK